jgi:hypothetical protein
VGRVSSLTPSGSASHSYGWRADGLRQWKQTSSGTDTYFLYDGAQPICEFIIQNGGVSLLAVNTWGPTGLAARNSPTTGSNTFYAWDGRGDVAQTVNTSGVVLGSFLFDGYGKATRGTPNDRLTSAQRYCILNRLS